MQISGRVQSCCVALVFALTTASAVKQLKSIHDLKKINFGQTVPKHSLVLLHWFANAVNIDNNNIVRLTFNPNSGDYGSHHYGNYEGLLDPPPPGQQYYTLGNLNQGSSELPDHVVHSQGEYAGRNLDRIILRVRNHNTGRQRLQRVYQVYITQHYAASENHGTMYDLHNTYCITTDLLRQIQEFSVGTDQQPLSALRDDFQSNADDFQLRHIKLSWGELACLGLFLFIVIEDKYCPKRASKGPQRSVRNNIETDYAIDNKYHPKRASTEPQRSVRNNIQSHYVVEIPEHLLYSDDGIHLQVTTGTNGKARIIWSGVPQHRLKNGAMVVLFRNNKDNEASSTYKYISNKESGSFDTSVPLNDGLQARLHKVRIKYCFWKVVGEEICRGPEFKNPQTATNIGSYGAKLQLFVKDGKACARLFVQKIFTEWRSEFVNSWVGFYTSSDKATHEYSWWQWQWAIKFKPNTDVKDFFYDVYDFYSELAIAPGVQARFMLSNKDVRATTISSWR